MTDTPAAAAARAPLDEDAILRDGADEHAGERRPDEVDAAPPPGRRARA